MYFVYLLQSEMDDSFYVGYSTDVTRRLQEHNEGESRYTSKKRPWKLVYVESFNTKREALIRERFLMQLTILTCLHNAPLPAP